MNETEINLFWLYDSKSRCTVFIFESYLIGERGQLGIFKDIHVRNTDEDLCLIITIPLFENTRCLTQPAGFLYMRFS